jgi:dTMP kinase
MREPGGGEVSEKIREILLSTKYTLDGLTELLLFSAARNENVRNIIQPALESGVSVLCDRFIDSTTVYQGMVRGLGAGFTDSINKRVVDICIPDLTIFYDIDSVQGLARVVGRGYDKNRIDLESMEFHENVRQSYILLEQREHRICKIDASNSIEEVFKETVKVVNPLFGINDED